MACPEPILPAGSGATNHVPQPADFVSQIPRVSLRCLSPNVGGLHGGLQLGSDTIFGCFDDSINSCLVHGVCWTTRHVVRRRRRFIVDEMQQLIATKPPSLDYVIRAEFNNSNRQLPTAQEVGVAD